MAPTFKYAEEQMKAAIEAVRGGSSVKGAARTHGVPKTTLLDKLRGRTPEVRRMGRICAVTNIFEREIVEWIKLSGRRGLPPKRDDVLNSVQQIVKREGINTPFKDGRPGKTWLKLFKKRWPSVVTRKPERVSKSRGSVKEEDIRAWFADLKKEMEELGVLDIFQDPTRVFNTDETNVQLAPDTGRVISIRGWKNVYELAPGPEKSNLTFLGTFSANGDIVKPMIIYPYQRIPSDIVNSVPDDWQIGSSETGWMKTETFYEFIANAFIPWLTEKNVQKPVILFVDGHKTHMSVEVSRLADENQIIIYLLPPNTTHILQPADVGPFKPLKSYWRREVSLFRQQNPNTLLNRRDVAPLLKKVLDSIKKESIINGFVATGLFPLNPDRPDYSKCLLPIEPAAVDQEKDGPVQERVDASEPTHVLGQQLSIQEKYKVCMEVLETELHETIVDELNQNIFILGPLQTLWNNIKTKAAVVNNIEEDEIIGDETISDETIGDETIGDESIDNETVIQQEQSNETVNRNEELQADAAENILLVDINDNIVMSIDECVIPNTSNEASASTSGITMPPADPFEGHQYFPGQIIYKKRKAPLEKIPCNVSAQKYRDYYAAKACNKKKPKKKTPNLAQKSKVTKTNDDWKCMYCKASWKAEDKAGISSRWVECDKCPRKTHIKCIPKTHMRWVCLDTNDSDEEIDYLCELCMQLVDSESSGN